MFFVWVYLSSNGLNERDDNAHARIQHNHVESRCDIKDKKKDKKKNTVTQLVF